MTSSPRVRLPFAAAAIAIAACLSLGTAGSATAQTVIRGPYLQMPTDSSIIVRWRTDIATDSRVQFGEVQGMPDTTVDDAIVTTEHEVELIDLDAATTYYYSVGTTGGPLAGGDADHRFRTSPTTGDVEATRIWAIGDSGFPEPGLGIFNSPRDGDAVRDAYTQWNGDVGSADVWLLLGDNAYPTATEETYQVALFEQYPSFVQTVAPWPTFGNHEAGPSNTLTQTGPYFDVFTIPTAGEAGGIGSGTESYYSFDYGNIHFVVLDAHFSILDTNQPARDMMLDWLEADLAATDADWVIAFWHQPPYSKGLFHDSDLERQEIDMRLHVNPIIEDYGVDLVLNGHSHSYERSMLIDGHYGLSNTLGPDMIVDGGLGDPNVDGPYEKANTGLTPHSGTVYVVAGSASEVRVLPGGHPVMAFELESLGSLVLDVDGDSVTGSFVDDQAAVQDTFQILKGTRCPKLKQTGCGEANRSRLTILDHQDDAKDRVSWSWKRGVLEPGDVGDPLVDEQLMGLCIYDASGLLVGSAPPTGAPEWSSRTSGHPLLPEMQQTTYLYRDSQQAATGLQRLRLRTHTEGQGRIVSRSRGPGLRLPAGPLAPPVTAQLRHTGSGQCWEGEFDDAEIRRNDGRRFSARD